MPRAKRALKLENLIPEKVPATIPRKRKKNDLLFSPTTGTRLMSPFLSSRSNHAKEQRDDLSNAAANNAEESDEIRESSKVLPIQPNTKEQEQMTNDDNANTGISGLLELQSEVEHSLQRFLRIRKKLTNLKALEGTRELENILGTSNKSGNLKIEVTNSRKLIEQIRKRDLQNPRAVSTQGDLQPDNSFAFLKSLIG
ncbi:centromere protein R [Erythrolamprus reginae]|uniref:centromere protein R n=1 Tax=Erythrolamprus reginae TaxID=121349 RepID=UPI00396C4975